MSQSHIAALILCTLGSVAAQDYSQTNTLYDGANCTGSSVVVTGHVPNLDSIGFDNKAVSVTIRGMWLYYDLVDYNWAMDAKTGYVFYASESCFNFLNPNVHSSVRFAGFPDDYRKDSITFYTFTWFQGTEEMVAEDRAMLALNLRISSFIYTGTSAWTIYDQPNYMGNSLCLQTPNANPAIVVDTTKTTPPIPHGSISSVRKGCFSTNMVTIGGENVSNAVNNQAGSRNVGFM